MFPLANTSEVVQAVKTPLALAALLLVLGMPVVKEVLKAKGKATETAREALRYGFVLGLVFGVMAIAAFVYTAGFNREIRISGTVRDESGAGVAFVTVGIAGREGGITDAGGNFAFT